MNFSPELQFKNAVAARGVHILDRAGSSYSWSSPPRRSAPTKSRDASRGVRWKIDSMAAVGWSELGAAVWRLLVEVADVDAEDVLELAAAEDK